MRKFLHLFIIGLLLTSCSESFLDVNPTDRVDEKEAFKSEKALNATVVGLYDFLDGTYTYGLYNIGLTDLRGGDMMLHSDYNWNRFPSLYEYSYTTQDQYVRRFYLNCYRVIEGANAIIGAYDKKQIKLDENITKEYVAEAKLLRALNYFNLVRLYSFPYSMNKGMSPGIPLKVDSDPNIHKGRGTVKDVYELIIKDLDFVLASGIKNQGVSRVGIDFAYGLYARVALTMEDYPNAIKYSKKVLDKHPLNSSFYDNGVSQNENSSLIFQIQYTEDTYSQYMSLISFFEYRKGNSGGYGTFGAAPDFIKNYSANDLRKNWFLNPYAYSNSWYLKGAFSETLELMKNKATFNKYVGKFWPAALWDTKNDVLDVEKAIRMQYDQSRMHSGMSLYGKFTRQGAEFVYGTNKIGSRGTALLGSVPMMRIPEMQLILAEAYALSGNDKDATTALNALRTIAHADLFNGGDVLKAIRLERRKELIGEGFRMYDVIRQQEKVTRLNYWGKDYKVLDPTDTNSRVYLPIPQKEIDNNTKMTEADQNPAYK